MSHRDFQLEAYYFRIRFLYNSHIFTKAIYFRYYKLILEEIGPYFDFMSSRDERSFEQLAQDSEPLWSEISDLVNV